MTTTAAAVEQMPETNLSQEDAARGRTYAILGALLAAPPSVELLDLLRSVAIETPDDAAAPAADMRVAWSVLQLAAERADPQTLADEYHALFIGLGRGELVPHGSWYLTGFLMEKPLGQLRRDLADLGFERQENVHEPEDHAAALCETMGMIIESDDIDFASQRRFYENHLEPWLGTFFRELSRAESANFYAAVGQFGECFVDIESRYFSMLA